MLYPGAGSKAPDVVIIITNTIRKAKRKSIKKTAEIRTKIWIKINIEAL